MISGAFDSLLAKLIVTGSSREDALERARRALDEFEVAGLPTVLPFHRKVVRDPAFTAVDGAFGVYTRWIETEFVNDIEPWGGVLADAAAPEKRHSVVVEVEGKRVSVSLPTKLLPSAIRRHAPAPTPRSGGGAIARDRRRRQGADAGHHREGRGRRGRQGRQGRPRRRARGDEDGAAAHRPQGRHRARRSTRPSARRCRPATSCSTLAD